MADVLAQIDALWARGIKCPVETLDDLDRLDDDEIVAGYRDWRPDDPEPGPNRSRAYWHGWCNAARDRGAKESTSAQRKLARAVVDRGDFARVFKGTEAVHG